MPKANNIPVVKGGVSISNIHAPEQKKHGEKIKLKHSNYLMTVNPNEAANPESEQAEQMAARLRTASDKFLENIWDFVELTEPGAEKTTKYIKQLRHKGVIEIGGKQNRVHSHMVVAIAHYTKLKLNYAKVKAFFNNEYYGSEEGGPGGKKIYVWTQLHRKANDIEDILENYLRKNMSNNNNEPSSND